MRVDEGEGDGVRRKRNGGGCLGKNKGRWDLCGGNTGFASFSRRKKKIVA